MRLLERCTGAYLNNGSMTNQEQDNVETGVKIKSTGRQGNWNDVAKSWD